MEEAIFTTGGGIMSVEDHSRRPISNTHIQSLPNEILALIFARLPAKDCSSVRLVCRSWYELSFNRAVTKEQKFVFQEGARFEEIAGFLLGTTIVDSTALLNLEFHHLSIDNLTPSVWVKCGHRVHSLFLRKCYFGYLTFARVIEHCVNLMAMTVEENRDYDGGDVNSPAVLTDLVDRRLVRPNLHTFVWFHEDRHLSMVVVRQIFAIFPSIKYFGTGPRLSYDYLLLSRVGEYDSSPYSKFDEYLNPSMKLERIVFNEPTDGSWIERSISKPEWSSRLIEFHTLFDYKNLPDFGRDLLFRFFAAQKNLEIVRLNELKGDEVFAKELMLCIFENCPKLRELQIQFKRAMLTGNFVIPELVTFQTYTEFARFFSFVAKLTCFVVNFDVVLDFPSETLSELPPTSFAMERLHLDQSIASEIFCRTVLTGCSKLKYLSLTVVFDDIVQEIFKNSDLQTLMLTTSVYHGPHFSELTDYGFTGKSERRSGGTSIKHLQKLEDLKIHLLDVETGGWQKQENGFVTRRSGVTLKTVQELQFPRLKSLDLHLELESQIEKLITKNPTEAPSLSSVFVTRPIFKLPGQTLIDLVSRLPSIEMLNILPTPEDFEAIVKVCKISKHLLFLQCSRVDGFDAIRLYEVCPNLIVQAL